MGIKNFYGGTESPIKKFYRGIKIFYTGQKTPYKKFLWGKNQKKERLHQPFKTLTIYSSITYSSILST